MVFNTISVSTAVGPTVIGTYFSHYLNRKSLREKPTIHITYHTGLNLIRRFLCYASRHTVEELQLFTSQWVPYPSWVKVEEFRIPHECIQRAVHNLVAQLGLDGIEKIGGTQWWQWRLEGSVLKAEWIEMKAHSAKRLKNNEECKRVMLYIHGGAYFFGSVDEHRYQLQRHARKLEARVFARMLVILRDRKIPSPAGAILISPWVDLSHSFPSVAGDGSLDYIPAHGFLHRPSAAWPPPNTNVQQKTAILAMKDTVPGKASGDVGVQTTDDATGGLSLNQTHALANPQSAGQSSSLSGAPEVENGPGDTMVRGQNLFITIDGKPMEIQDQIQLYTTNQMISHPLVSPVLTPILGGLPPLLILTGGAEILRDEQIYLAHKAARPLEFPPSEAYLENHPEARKLLSECRPTYVQLQVWDDLCHVAPTLSFTKPAKHMYRSIARFGAWALGWDQKRNVYIRNDDEPALLSSSSDDDVRTPAQGGRLLRDRASAEHVKRAGDPIPHFTDSMIRERVNRHGIIRPLEDPSLLPALAMPVNEIGVIKPGPVLKWTEAKQTWDKKYAKESQKVQKQRAHESAAGFQQFTQDGRVERPPPSALAGRRGPLLPTAEKEESKKSKSWGMSLWSIWGSAYDEKAIVQEEKEDKGSENQPAAAAQDRVEDSAGDGSHSQSQPCQRPKSILKNPLPANSMNGVIPLKDGSTRKNSIETLKPHGDVDADQPRNIIVGEPSVAEKMSWALPDPSCSSGASTIQAPQDPASIAGVSMTQVSSDLSGTDPASCTK